MKMMEQTKLVSRTMLLVAGVCVLVGACGGRGAPASSQPPPPPPPRPFQLMPNTKVLNSDARAAVESFDSATGELRVVAASPIAANLKTGDVLVSAPTATTPYGLLRKVTSVVTQGGDTIVATAPAGLDEAIKSGSLEVSFDVTPAQVRSALRGDLRSRLLSGGKSFHDEISWSESGDGWAVGVDGAADYGYSWKVGLSFNHPECDADPGMPCYEFYAYAIMNDTARVHVTGSVNKSFAKDITIADHQFDPITIDFFGVPLVFVPKASVHLQVGGSGAGSLDYTATAHGPQMQLGAHWDSIHDWTPYNTISGLGFDPAPADLRAAIDVYARVPVEGELMLYDLVGPQVTVTAEGDAHFHIPGKPRWSISGHLRGDVGVKVVDIPLLPKLGGYETNLFTFDGTIAESTNNPPRVSIALPGPGSKIGLAGPDFGIVHFVANVDDDEDGPDCCAVTWTVDGTVLGTGRELSHTFAAAGPHSVVATAVDSDGAAASTAPVTFAIGDAPPGARILLPAASCSTQVYASVPVELQGSNTRPFLSQLPFRCDWFSDNPADTQFPISVLEQSAGCDATASNCCKSSTRFASAGPRNLTLVVTQFDNAGIPTAQSADIKFVQVFDKPAGPVPVLEVPGLTECSSSVVGITSGSVDLFAEIFGGTRPLTSSFTWQPGNCAQAVVPAHATPPISCTNFGCATKFSILGSDLLAATPPQCQGAAAAGTVTMTTVDASGIANSQSIFVRLIDDTPPR